MRLALSALAFVALALPAWAQVGPGTAADPDSVEARIGASVLAFVAGRTREEAGNDDFNPFGMDADTLLFDAGAFFIVSEWTGEPLREGELAVYPQYAMPQGQGTPSAATPPTIPFALMQQGFCHAGYVTGYPVPDAIFALDLGAAPCHAESVVQLLADAYLLAQPEQAPVPDLETPPADLPVAVPGFDPAAPRDVDLQSAVYAAYDAAYTLALATPDYQFWNGTDFAPVRDAVLAALSAQGLNRITLISAPVADPATAMACAAPGSTELRIAFTPDTFAITVAAASAERVYAYQYDSAISPDLQIIEPRECATAGPGRAGPRN